MTRGRLITLVIVGAVGLLAYFVASISSWEEITVPTPLQGEAAINPFYAAERLVEDLGSDADWSRDLTQLPPAETAMLLTGWHWNVSTPRRTRLEKWVESGGRLIVDSSIVGIDELTEWLGITIVYPFEDEDEDESESTMVERTAEDSAEDEPLEDCRSFSHVVTRALLEREREPWTLCSMSYARRFEAPEGETTWRLDDEIGAQVVRVTRGRGSVTIVDGSPFMWRELQRVDHAVLLVNALQLRRNDRVLFVSGDREQSLLDLIWRYGWPVVILSLLATLALLWRRSARLGPPLPEPDPARRSLGEQILGTGRFIFRSGGAHALHTAAMQALDRIAEQRLRGYGRMSEAERVAMLAEATAIESGRLANARDWPRAGRKSELATAVASLEAARRLIASLKPR
jgi:hypothetical protein